MTWQDDLVPPMTIQEAACLQSDRVGEGGYQLLVSAPSLYNLVQILLRISTIHDLVGNNHITCNCHFACLDTLCIMVGENYLVPCILKHCAVKLVSSGCDWVRLQLGAAAIGCSCSQAYAKQCNCHGWYV